MKARFVMLLLTGLITSLPLTAQQPAAGIQVESMWSEMFFNRSFESFMPYRDINKLWYDVVYDEKDLSKGYERDWSKFDWYHSGYEHNSWFAAPGTPPRASWIDDTSRFVVSVTPPKKVVLSLVKGGSGHGQQCLQVTNNEPSEWAAVAQEGKLLRKGETYHFTGMFKSVSGMPEAEIRIYPQGNWSTPLFTFPLKTLNPSFTLVPFTLSLDFEGYVTFSVWIPGKSSIQIGMSSYGDRPGRKPFHQVIDDMLDIAGPYIDFLADRADADKESEYMLGKVRLKSGTCSVAVPAYSFTEIVLE